MSCSYRGHKLFLKTHLRCRYINRLHELLRDFGARFSDIDAIHQQALAAECVQVKPTWWKRLLPSFCRGLAADAGGILSFMTTLDESQVIEVTTDALGAKLPAHRDFDARHRIDNAAAKRVQRNLTSSNRHSAGAHETTATLSPQQRTSSAFHESAAASRGYKTSGAAEPSSYSLECSTRNEVASAELVEVVVDPPSAVTVERNGRTSASGNQRDRIPTRMPTNMRASSRPKRLLERDGHGASQFSSAHHLSTPQVKLPTNFADSATSGLPRPGVQRPRDPGSLAQPSEAPPPFDEEDLKLAERREAKAAARAAQKQSSLSATSALGWTGSDARLRLGSNAVAEPSEAPPPFDEEDLKLAERREAKAAARAAQKQSSLSATSASRSSGSRSGNRRDQAQC